MLVEGRGFELQVWNWRREGNKIWRGEREREGLGLFFWQIWEIFGRVFWAFWGLVFVGWVENWIGISGSLRSMATAMMVGKNLAALGTVESSIFKGSGGGGSQLVWEKKSELGQAAQSFFPMAVKLRNDLQWRACSNHNSRPPPPAPASNSLIQQITEPQKTWQPSSGVPKLTKVEQQKPSESSSSLQTVNDSGPPRVSTKDLVSLQLPSKPWMDGKGGKALPGIEFPFVLPSSLVCWESCVPSL